MNTGAYISPTNAMRPHLRSLGGPAIACLLGAILGMAFLFSPLLGVGVAVGLAIICWLVPRWMQMSYILIAAIAFSSAIPRGQLIPFLKPNEIVLVAAILLLPIGMVRRAWPGKIPGLLLVSFAIFGLGTSVVPTMLYWLRGVSLTVDELLNLLAPLQYLIIFWFFASVPQNEAQRHGVIQFMFFTSSVVAFVGLLQAAGVGPVVKFLSAWYPSTHTTQSAEAGRVTSVFGAWNSLGTFMMFNLVIALAFQNYPRSRIYQANTLIMVCLALPCLLATNFYAAILGMAVSFLMLKIMDPRGFGIILVAGLLVLVTAIAYWPQIDARLQAQFGDGELLPQTIRFRIEVWEKYYIDPILENPYSGVSPSTDQLGFAFPESQYIFLMYRSGVLSMIAHVLWVLALLGWLFRRIRNTNGLPRNLASALFTLLIVLSVIGAVNPVFTFSGTIDFLWINLALAMHEGGC